MHLDAMIEAMAAAADRLPGPFRAEIGLVYHAGVANGAPWQCDVEADIATGDGDPLSTYAATPQEAVVAMLGRLPAV